MHTHIALILLLLSCAAASARTFTDKATNLHFPDVIGEWQKTKVTQFPAKELGVEVDYKNQADAIASFYIYTAGVSKIPTGAENSVVRAQFTETQREMISYIQNRFKNVSKVLESTPDVTHEGKRATLLATAYKFSGDRNWLSWALLTGYRNRFLKLRYTQPFDSPEADIPRGQRELRNLIVGFLGKNEDNTEAFWMPSHR